MHDESICNNELEYFNLCRPQILRRKRETKTETQKHGYLYETYENGGRVESTLHPLRFFALYSKNLQMTPIWKVLTFPKCLFRMALWIFYQHFCFKQYEVKTRVKRVREVFFWRNFWKIFKIKFFKGQILKPLSVRSTLKTEI